jgi:hypothetical protein
MCVVVNKFRSVKLKGDIALCLEKKSCQQKH